MNASPSGIIIKPCFENLSILGWRTPLSFRKENLYSVGPGHVVFDPAGDEIIRTDGQARQLLARCRLRPRSKVFESKGLYGKISAEGLSISLDPDPCSGIIFSIDEAGVKWSFLLKPSPRVDLIRVDLPGFRLAVGRAGLSGATDDHISIECDETRMKTVEIIGVVACAIVFDHFLDINVG